MIKSKNLLLVLLSVLSLSMTTPATAGCCKKLWKKVKTAAHKTVKAAEKAASGIGHAVEGTVKAPVALVTGKSVSKELKKVGDGIVDTVTGTVETAGYGTLTVVGGAAVGIGATVDTVLDVGNGIGKEVEDYICGLVGKEPGKGCNVSGGISVSTNGDINLIDGSGNPSEKQAAAEEVNFYFDSAVWYDGSTKFVLPDELYEAAKEFKEKTIWPGEPIAYEIFPPNRTGEIRSDEAGSGYYGAPRKNAYGFHRGIDFLSKAGTDTVAPVSGVIIRITPVYSDKVKNKNLTGVVIRNTSNGNYETKVFYVEPNEDIKPGKIVVAGITLLGKTQSMMFIHANAQDHIHVEIDRIDGTSNSLVPVTRKWLENIM